MSLPMGIWSSSYSSQSDHLCCIINRSNSLNNLCEEGCCCQPFKQLKQVIGPSKSNIYDTVLVAIEDAVCADKMLAVISSNGDVARMLMGENCRTYCSEF